MSHDTALMELLKPRKANYGLSFKTGSKVLILSPHADDEAIGCGGLIAGLADADKQKIEVVLFTTSGKRRLEEMENAKLVLGYSALHILDIEDGKLKDWLSYGTERLEEIMDSFKPDILFVPYVLDFVSDHFHTNVCLKSVLEKKTCFDVKIYMYEVWNMIVYPNIYFDITGYAAVKKEALGCYGSQEKKYNILEKAKLINDYRYEFNFRKKYKHLECFLETDKGKYIDILNGFCE